MKPGRGRVIRLRPFLLQALALVLLLWLGWEIASNIIANLKKQNIASGFGFLDNTAGFSIIQTLIPYDERSSYGRAFVVGLLNTLLVAVTGIALATVLGFLIGVARLSRNWLIAQIAAVYVEVIRNIPLLLQLFFWYFAVLRQLPPPQQSLTLGEAVFLNNRGLYLPAPILGDGQALVMAGLLAAAFCAGALFWNGGRRARGLAPLPRRLTALAAAALAALAIAAASSIRMETPAMRGLNIAGGVRIIPELAALILALTLYSAAFIAEIVRAGIQSVPHGQVEAAYALGLKPWQALRLIIIPQALRLIIPPLTSQYLNLTKNSSLAVAIAYPDLVSVFAGIVLNQTGQAVEVLALTMAVYLALSLLAAGIMTMINVRQAASSW